MKFNTQGSRARVIVELAFGKLKGQWACLSQGLETRTDEDWKLIVTTCCILHNLTISVGGQGWKFEDKFLSTSRRDQSAASLPKDPNVCVPKPGDVHDSPVAINWRDALMENLKEWGII